MFIFWNIDLSGDLYTWANLFLREPSARASKIKDLKEEISIDEVVAFVSIKTTVPG